ncbi:MAG TPA: peptidoglycan DD-metalloendopeptidase family protein [Bacteroidia bacterium]|nr:peptidoglycan DD-metalloendopeptidase family protein [Bacteroidia bacterium]
MLRSFFWPGQTPTFLIRFVKIGLIFSLALLSTTIQAQSKKELQKKKAQLQKDIEYTNKMLSQTKKNKSASLNQLVTLNKKISKRTELISTISTELNGVEKEISKVAGNIDSLDHQLNVLRKQYASMLYYAYKNQNSYSSLMFIFSADDFNQAWKRMKYIRLLSDYRVQQRNLIVQVQDSLAGKRQILQNVKKDKASLLTVQETQKQLLDKEKKEQVKTLNSLTSKEKKYRKDLREKQKQEQLLATKIEKIIRKEIEMAQEAARKKAASSATADASKKKLSSVNSSTILASTPEAIRLSNDFESNKGKLPWPVEQGFISSSFGKHTHPLWKDVVVNNNGIDINSSKGAKARSVFEGTVLRVIMVVDKYAVLVQHGEYFSLYSNLQEVFVKSGDKIMTKQVLGLVLTNEEDGKTEVHLEIWKGSNKMDPEGWLAKN